jgi:hypothetical protein
LTLLAEAIQVVNCLADCLMRGSLKTWMKKKPFIRLITSSQASASYYGLPYMG